MNTTGNEEGIRLLESRVTAMGMDPKNGNHLEYVISLVQFASHKLPEAYRDTLRVISIEAPITQDDLLAKYPDRVTLDVVTNLKQLGAIAKVVIGYQHHYWACTPEGFDLNRIAGILEQEGKNVR